MLINRVKSIEVFYRNRVVGTLLALPEGGSAFEYNDEWLQNGFSISPFTLPLQKKVFLPFLEPFFGIAGVFNDSLPDGWGKLLIDRLLVKNGYSIGSISAFERLTIVGESAMGALNYRPMQEMPTEIVSSDLDVLAQACREILATNTTANLDELVAVAGSSGGARTKVLLDIDGESWLVKFAASFDPVNITQMEYDYSVAARKAGIEMMETKLFPSQDGRGYFGMRRFDRNTRGETIHMLSASGLLEVSHRVPTLDYINLLMATWKLTDNFEEVKKMYRLMCFNVLAGNMDDHSNNFSFLYDENEASWRVAPGYDLVRSDGVYGEHATMVAGVGKNPGKDDLLRVAEKVDFSRRVAKAIIDEVQTVVEEDLKEYL